MHTPARRAADRCEARGLEPLEARLVQSASLMIDASGHVAPVGSPVNASLPPLMISAGASAGAVAAHTAINLSGFRADPRFANVRGQGFASVIIDTGINSSHPFFGPDANNDGIADRIVFQKDFTSSAARAIDGHGHGSHVASLVAGDSASYPGVAPGANIIVLKVLDNSGAGSFSAIEQALQWVVANGAAYNVVSVNMSLGDGGNYASRTGRFGIGDELAALASRGIIVAAAAGNSYGSFNAPGLAYPAADPNTISVGATFAANYGQASFSDSSAYSTNVDVITPFSQRITGMDIFAPGAFLVGAAKSGTGVVTMAGTSMASPIVAGAAVLAQQVATTYLGRKLSVAEFRQVLTSSGDLITDGDDENDSVTNTGLNFRRLDMLALASAIVSMAGGGTPSPVDPPTPPPPGPPANPIGNDAPTLGTPDPLSISSRSVRVTITHAMLADATHASDPDGDPISLRVSALRGILLVNNVRVRGEATLSQGDSLQWVAPGRSGVYNALRVTAVDPSGARSGTAVVQVRYNVRSLRARSDTAEATAGHTAAVMLRLSLTPAPAHPPTGYDYRVLAPSVMGAGGRFFV